MSRQRQLAALTSSLARTAGQAALRRALPLYGGLLIVAVLLFGGKYAMKASELTGVARHSLAFAALMLGGWLVLSLPVARALLASPSAFPLRAFPIPWPAAAAVLGVGLVALEAPWLILWVRGAGPLAGAGALVLAAGAHATLVGRPRRWCERAAVLLWLAGFLGGPGWPWLLGLPALVVGLRRAWISAPEPRGARGPGRVRARSRLTALAGAGLFSLWRGQRPVLGRWLWLAAGGAAAGALGIANNGPAGRAHAPAIVLGTLAAVATLGGMAVGGALLRTERQAAWLLEVAGATRTTRNAAAGLAGAAWGAAFGAMHGLVVAILVDQSMVALVALGAAGGATSAAAAVQVARWADRGTGQDGGRVLVAALALSAGTVALVAVAGVPAIAVVAALAAALPVVLPAPRQPARVVARAAADQD